MSAFTNDAGYMKEGTQPGDIYLVAKQTVDDRINGGDVFLKAADGTNGLDFGPTITMLSAQYWTGHEVWGDINIRAGFGSGSPQGTIRIVSGTSYTGIGGDIILTAPGGNHVVVTNGNLVDGSNNAYLTAANSVSDLTGGSTVASNASDGETAYGWGNHASAGYLTSESDPVFSAWYSNFGTNFASDVAYIIGQNTNGYFNAGNLTSLDVAGALGFAPVDGSFVDNSSGANWAGTAPTTTNDAINRIAALLSVGGTTPIP